MHATESWNDPILGAPTGEYFIRRTLLHVGSELRYDLALVRNVCFIVAHQCHINRQNSMHREWLVPLRHSNHYQWTQCFGANSWSFPIRRYINIYNNHIYIPGASNILQACSLILCKSQFKRLWMRQTNATDNTINATLEWWNIIWFWFEFILAQIANK